MRGSIRSQLTFIICLLIGIALFSALSISYSLALADYEKKMQQNNSAMADSLAFNIAQFMQNAYNANSSIAEFSGVDFINAKRQNNLVLNAVKRYPFFDIIAVHDLQGDQIARSSGDLANRSERWWFKKFLAEESPFVSDTYYSLLSESPITTIIHGIYSDDRLVGVLMADIEIRKLQEMIDNYNLGAGSYAYLLDGEGVVIAHPDRNQVAELYNYKTMKKRALLRDVNGNMVKDENNNEITQEFEFKVTPSLQSIVNRVMNGEQGAGEYTDLNGEQYVCAYRSIPMPGKSSPWSLIVVQKRSAALAFMNDITIKAVSVGILVMAFAMPLTIWFSRRLTNPIIDIVKATDQIKNGDLSVQLGIKSANEIGVLAMNFNQMVGELRQHREQLEELVEARTCALAAANQEMLAMNEELAAMNETLEDTNQQLNNENKVRRQTEENLLLRERQYRATTNLLTLPIDKIEGLYDSILNNAIKLLKGVSGYIGFFDEGKKLFYIHRGIGIDESRVMEPQSIEIGMQGQVYRTGEICYVEDYQSYPNRIYDKRFDDITSVVMMPLKQAGKVKGILAVSWVDNIHSISKEDIEILRQFGDLAAVALERAASHDTIRKMAFNDTLTGLPNRASLNLYLDSELEKARCGKSSGIILFIDIDDLKAVNDNFGHSCGDEIIIKASRHLVNTVGEAFVSCLGGDEFIVVLPGKYTRGQAAQVADITVQALCQEYSVSSERLYISASIGVALYPDDGDEAEDILKKADSAMYAAKKAGRNCWRFYEPILSQEAYEKMILTNALRRALERGELFLHYQPQVALESYKIIGFEALLRWNSKEYGFVSPARFIPLAEQSRLILPIGQWVLQEACRFARRLADMGKENIRVAVNISPKQLAAQEFVTVVEKSINDAGINPGQIEIEITENVLIESIDDSVRKLCQLRNNGIALALDDFGTGYSSLTYLRSLPVAVLKIDKSFIDNITKDATELKIVGSIIDVGHTLSLAVVAEGVEDKEQLKLLKQIGCDCIQGYVFSRPVTEEEAINLINGEI